MKKPNTEKGITLIALIITIIVLLILAGITLNMLIGEDGILIYTERAKEEYEIEQGKERIELLLADASIDTIVSREELTVDKIVEALDGKEGIAGVTAAGENKVTVTTTEGYVYDVIINEQGKTEVKYIRKTTEPIINVSLEVGNITTNSAILTIIKEDEKNEIVEYRYYLRDELKQTSTTNSYTYTELSSDTDYVLKVIVKDKEGNEVTKTTSITTETNVGEVLTENTKTVPIPKGYVASKVTGENTIASGLVIYEGTVDVIAQNHAEALKTKNQYVWIPVDDINSMSMCKSNKEGSVCNLKLQTDGTLKCEVHPDTATEIVARLYTTYSYSAFRIDEYTGYMIYTREIDFTKVSQTYDANGGNREPGVVTNNNNGSGIEYDGANYHGYETASAFLELLEKEYIRMATSVAKNGGFYISRYEMGETGASKKDQTIINAGTESANMWYGLYNIAKNANKTLNSHMIWGSQYDQIIKFIGAESQTAAINRNVKTSSNSGTNAYDKRKNIYDLEGNHLEWTCEAKDSNNRVYRGGDYVNSDDGFFYPASIRNTTNPTDQNSVISSRITLYL